MHGPQRLTQHPESPTRTEAARARRGATVERHTPPAAARAEGHLTDPSGPEHRS